MISHSVDGSVAIALLDRPDKLNAMPRSFWGELTETLDRAAADPEVRVLVFRREGRCFGEIGDTADRRAYVTAQTREQIIAGIDFAWGSGERVTAAGGE